MASTFVGLLVVGLATGMLLTHKDEDDHPPAKKAGNNKKSAVDGVVNVFKSAWDFATTGRDNDQPSMQKTTAFAPAIAAQIVARRVGGNTYVVQHFLMVDHSLVPPANPNQLPDDQYPVVLLHPTEEGNGWYVMSYKAFQNYLSTGKMEDLSLLSATSLRVAKHVTDAKELLASAIAFKEQMDRSLVMIAAEKANPIVSQWMGHTPNPKFAAWREMTDRVQREKGPAKAPSPPSSPTSGGSGGGGGGFLSRLGFGKKTEPPSGGVFTPPPSYSTVDPLSGSGGSSGGGGGGGLVPIATGFLDGSGSGGSSGSSGTTSSAVAGYGAFVPVGGGGSSSGGSGSGGGYVASGLSGLPVVQPPPVTSAYVADQQLQCLSVINDWATDVFTKCKCVSKCSSLGYFQSYCYTPKESEDLECPFIPSSNIDNMQWQKPSPLSSYNGIYKLFATNDTRQRSCNLEFEYPMGDPTHKDFLRSDNTALQNWCQKYKNDKTGHQESMALKVALFVNYCQHKRKQGALKPEYQTCLSVFE